MTDPQGHTERFEAALADRYKIERKLGEGGMASVYLAEDIKHERKVALKILRPELAAVIGAERFLSEIKTTANLQHPHILPLFDSGEADGYLYYVMPYIDGETLREKLERERQLGVDEALRIARDVADALDYAHRNDIIHRDIKPANVLLHDGRPVVADFGIALAVTAAGGGRLTETGLSLGTPHYMSPEQASADRDLSARSDVYSLGCVLYEMIAGQPPHTGPSAQSILVRILTDQPRPLTELRHTVPPHVAATVTKAIEKLPADRFETARAFIDALDDETFAYAPTGTAHAAVTATPIAAPAPVSAAAGGRAVPLWMAAAAGVATLLGGFTVARLTQAEPPPPPSATFTITGDSSHMIVSPCCGRAVAISAAGDRIVYQGRPGTGDQLYQRPLNERVARPIPGTDGARHPFFAPDGEWLGFFVSGSLMKVRFDGGSPLTVASGLGTEQGAAWGPDNSIAYGTADAAVLFRVPEDGGESVPITQLDTLAGEQEHRWPHVLPDGSVLFTVLARSDGGGGRLELLALVGPEGGAHRIVGPGSDSRYVDPGYVTYSDGSGSVMAQRFDPANGEFTDSRFRIAERAVVRAGSGMMEYDVSRTGTVVYQESGTAEDGLNDLVVVDPEGGAEVLTTTGVIRQPRFSPDGRYIAYEQFVGDRADIWTWDRDRSNEIRVTFDGDSRWPTWSPDGVTIYFRQGGGIGSRPRDGSGVTELVEGDVGNARLVTSGDGEWLLWSRSGGLGGFDIWIKPLDGSEEPRPLIATPFSEDSPAVSPDGRWIAYTSDETGQDEVYVEPFPALGVKFKVTSSGGESPLWAPDGSALHFLAGTSAADADLVRVDVIPGEEFDVGPERVLFPSSYAPRGGATNYDIHPDGDLFVFVAGAGAGQAGAVTAHVVITNALSVESRD